MKTSRITLLAIIVVLTIITSNLNWYSNHWKDFLESDAKGYYAYLPAVFVYEDLHFGFFDEIEKEKYSNAADIYDYRENYEGVLINKY